MKVQVSGTGGKGFQTIDATRLVVFDDFGNPIAFAAKFGDGQHIAATLKDPEFELLINTLGLKLPRIGKMIEIDTVD